MKKRKSGTNTRRNPKKINLALQGGGAHGAYTWGVLDRLIESERIEINAISGTSAGAMNAVVLADGLMVGGKTGARNALRQFWKAVNQAAAFSPMRRTPYDTLTGNWNLDYSAGYLFFDIFSRMASPYQLNPLNLNPLRDLLVDQVDFERVRSCDKLKLFISATSVRNGQVKVFERGSLTVDAVMASAGLPQIFQAVNVDGEDYWDGGYAGNPVLYPFAYHSDSHDIVIVQINPLSCQDTPRAARDILNRVNEITFNASLLHELRAIDFVARMLDEGSLDPERYRKMLIHIIADDKGFQNLNASSKMNTEWEFLDHLHNLGYRAADDWLAVNFEQLGKRSSVNVRGLLHGCPRG
ncbi:MAG: patatin-like phospholipase family protein [Desulfobacterales bacterium]